MNILITGVSGFIGNYLSEFFYKRYNIYGLGKDIKNDKIFNNDNFLISTLPSIHIDQYLVDKNIDVIIHCAGKSSVINSIKDPTSDFKSGPEVVFGLLNSILKTKKSIKFIFLSSAAVYGNTSKLPIDEDTKTSPVSVYGYHKLISEMICKEFYHNYNIPSVSLRIFSAYGRGLNRQVIWDIVQKAKSEENVYLNGNGNETRDFIHIIDIARAIDIVIKKSQFQSDIINIGSGSEISIEKLAYLIIQSLNLKKNIIFNNKNTTENPKFWRCDTTKLLKLGYENSISLESGIQDYVSWINSIKE